MQVGQMSLEYITKLIILLVVVVVSVGLIMSFSSQIKYQVSCFFFGDCGEKNKVTSGNFPITIKEKEFTISQVANYIESCYDTFSSLPEEEQEDKDCYVLIADYPFRNMINKKDLLNYLDERIREHVEFKATLNKEVLTISFEDLGNKVVISD